MTRLRSDVTVWTYCKAARSGGARAGSTGWRIRSLLSHCGAQYGHDLGVALRLRPAQGVVSPDVLHVRVGAGIEQRGDGRGVAIAGRRVQRGLSPPVPPVRVGTGVEQGGDARSVA